MVRLLAMIGYFIFAMEYKYIYPSGDMDISPIGDNSAAALCYMKFRHYVIPK